MCTNVDKPGFLVNTWFLHTLTPQTKLFLKPVKAMPRCSTRADLKQLWTAHDGIRTTHTDPKTPSVFNTWPLQKTVTSLQRRRRPTFDTSPVVLFKEMHLFLWLRVALLLCNPPLEKRSLGYARCLLYPFFAPPLSSHLTSVTAVYHPASNELSPHILIVSPELWKQSSAHHQHGVELTAERGAFPNSRKRNHQIVVFHPLSTPSCAFLSSLWRI